MRVQLRDDGSPSTMITFAACGHVAFTRDGIHRCERLIPGQPTEVRCKVCYDRHMRSIQERRKAARRARREALEAVRTDRPVVDAEALYAAVEERVEAILARLRTAVADLDELTTTGAGDR